LDWRRILHGLASLFHAPDLSPRAYLGVERSASGRTWRERLDPAGIRQALAISQGHNVPDLVARVLAGRGVTSADLPAFFDPTLRSLLPDPARLTDMEKAAERIARAIETGEKVAIFGDYDVDGASSAAILSRFFRSQGLDTTIYIPDRLFEGYGPNPQAMLGLAAAGIRLVIAVDCGTTAFEALDTAKGAGLEVIVIDHHQVGHELPAAFAVVNPNRADDISGLGHLAAAGLVFIAVVAVNRVLRLKGWYATRREPDLLTLLDLVALATVCDVVSLSGVNRAFVAKGLAVLRRGGNPGLAALSVFARLGGPAQPYHLGFLLGPRINAGGRIGDAALGARLLSIDDPVEAERIAGTLDRLNRERQEIERTMLEEATAAADATVAGGPGPAVLLATGDTWHPGIVGIVAARLRERFHRPAFAIAFGPNGTGSGSGRSIPGVDLGAAVRAAVDAGILEKGGGHAMAAGLTLSRERLADLAAFFEATLGAAVREATNVRVIDIDGSLLARAATLDLVELLDRAGPYGAGHPEPVFAIPAHTVAYAETVGQGHVRVSLASGGGPAVKAMAFRAADLPLGRTLLEARGSQLHVAATLGVDEWNARREPALRILDVARPDRA
jgi:single-stranded-DNA-specific exonuclease